MTNLQARRKRAVRIEQARDSDGGRPKTDIERWGKADPKVKTVVVGLRMSQEIYDALVEAKENSAGEWGGGMPLSRFILEGAIDSKLRAR